METPEEKRKTKSSQTGKNHKYIKEIQDPHLIIELQDLTNSLIINITNFKQMISVNYSSEFSLDEIINKNESLISSKSIEKIFEFFSKLLEKNKFKVEEKINTYILTFYY